MQTEPMEILFVILLLLIGALIGVTVQWYLNYLDKKHTIKKIIKVDNDKELRENLVNEIIEAVAEDINDISYCANRALLEIYLGSGCNSCKYYDSDTKSCKKHLNENWFDLEAPCNGWEHFELCEESCYEHVTEMVNELKEVGFEKFEKKYYD